MASLSKAWQARQCQVTQRAQQCCCCECEWSIPCQWHLAQKAPQYGSHASRAVGLAAAHAAASSTGPGSLCRYRDGSRCEQRARWCCCLASQTQRQWQWQWQWKLAPFPHLWTGTCQTERMSSSTWRTPMTSQRALHLAPGSRPHTPHCLDTTAGDARPRFLASWRGSGQPAAATSAATQKHGDQACLHGCTRQSQRS